MNTKVEEALGVLAYEAQAHRDDGNTTPADALDKARTTLAAHIAQQDATIARLFTREQVAELMRGMVPDEIGDCAADSWENGNNNCRTETLARIEAWQNQEQGK